MTDKRILLAGIDLDGTLLHNDKTVSEKSLEALRNAAKRGVHIVPVTGRPLSGVPAFIKELDEVEYIVTSNGAYITNVKTNETVYSKTLSNEKALEYIEKAETAGLYCEAFCEGYGYVDEKTMERHIRELSGTPIYEYIISTRDVVKSVFDYVKNRDCGVDELFCIAQSPAQREAFRRQVEGDCAVQYCELEDIFIELTDSEVDKGAALGRLCALLGVPAENTVAFGDGENDLSFLKAAGVSVAMGNAKQILKECATLVTDTNENDGVAKILEKII